MSQNLVYCALIPNFTQINIRQPVASFTAHMPRKLQRSRNPQGCEARKAMIECTLTDP